MAVTKEKAWAQRVATLQIEGLIEVQQKYMVTRKQLHNARANKGSQDVKPLEIEVAKLADAVEDQRAIAQSAKELVKLFCD